MPPPHSRAVPFERIALGRPEPVSPRASPVRLGRTSRPQVIQSAASRIHSPAPFGATPRRPSRRELNRRPPRPPGKICGIPWHARRLASAHLARRGLRAILRLIVHPRFLWHPVACPPATRSSPFVSLRSAARVGRRFFVLHVPSAPIRTKPWHPAVCPAACRSILPLRGPSSAATVGRRPLRNSSRRPHPRSPSRLTSQPPRVDNHPRRYARGWRGDDATQARGWGGPPARLRIGRLRLSLLPRGRRAGGEGRPHSLLAYAARAEQSPWG
jgi:hypothetical protein